MTGWEIDNIVQSPTGKRMIKRVSPVYDNSVFMKFFYEGEGSEYDKVRNFFLTLREQSFTKTVDWGIELQERKYSIIPDNSLDLEERRARLKIKLQSKYPLNPAILERIAKDNFALDVYLNESKHPGYITFEVKSFNSAAKFIKWLVEEKPAHLMIWAIIHRIIPFTAYAGIVHHKWGRKRIPKLDTVTIEPNKITVELNGREIVITPNKVTSDSGGKKVAVVNSQTEQLQLNLAFPTGSRTLSFENPRQDLTADEIQSVANYAINNDLLIKTDEDNTADDLTWAKLVTKNKTILF